MFQKKRRRVNGVVLISMLIISLLAHLFYIITWQQGTVMKGINDGLSQMLPFKQFIYNQYAEGRFFYSADFGLGGDFFSSLAYYFTTNLFFLPWVAITWGFATLFQFTPDFDYWTMLVLPMSIFKQTVIMFVAYIFLKQILQSIRGAYVGAVFYALSPFFFRHEMYWDILTDAMFWLPLILIGVERIIRKQSLFVFTLSAALMMISNFYLSYVVLLTAVIYMIVRQFMHLTDNERSAFEQLKRYIASGIISFALACFAFIPAAYGFINNVRPPFQDPIKGFEINDAIIMSPRVLWLPIFIFILFFIKPLYRHRTFRFFAIFAGGGIIAHFIPYIGSIFNGFSAPQQRWESIVILSFAGMLGVAIKYFEEWRRDRTIVYGVIGFIALWSLFIWLIPQYESSVPLLITTAIWLVIFAITQWYRAPLIWFSASILVFSIIEANIFSEDLTKTGVATKSFITSEAYHSNEQQQAVEWMQQRKVSKDARIDWMVPYRNNTPMVQNFRGTSIYSSILNGDLLLWYLRDLQIDMARESVSRYGTLGNRTNLMAMQQVQFYMREKSNEAVPYNYRLVKVNENTQIYENDQYLPVFRIATKTYRQSDLDDAPVLAKEHAMLDGVIMTDGKEKAPKVKKRKILSNTVQGGYWDGEELIINQDKGRVAFSLAPIMGAKTMYVQMYIEGIRNYTGFTIEANEYRTTRKKSNSIYRTNYNHITLAIDASNQLLIELPKGTYRLKDVAIYDEDYTTLNAAYNKKNEADVSWNHGEAKGEVTVKKDDVLVSSIPYEKGWHAKVDGKKVAVEKVNYAFVGVPMKETGKHEVELYYRPPYWPYALWVSVITWIGFLLYWWRQRQKIPKWQRV